MKEPVIAECARLSARHGKRSEGVSMPAYRMVYGDDEQVVRETFQDVQVDREDGWTVLFRGKNAILRVRDEHVQSLELLPETARSEADPRRSGPSGGGSDVARGPERGAGPSGPTPTATRRP